MYLLIINIIYIYYIYFWKYTNTLQKDKRQETSLTYYISYIYIAFLKNCVSLFCRVVFSSYLCIEKVSRNVSKNTKVTSNKPKNSQKSSKILFKIQHKPSKMNQKPTFFHSKTPKMMHPFFELGESWRKTPPLSVSKTRTYLAKNGAKVFQNSLLWVEKAPNFRSERF